MGNAIKGHIEHAEKTGVCQLSSMNINEFPSQLLHLAKKLRTLDLSHNKIEILPEAIGSFAVLKTLNLSYNRLSSVCTGICKLSKLETLTLDNNRLTSLPKGIGQCIALKAVSISGNKLKSFPDGFSTLKHLNSLDLSKNSIVNIPDSVESLQVVELNLNQNQISVIPESVASCPRLKVLRFEENCVQLDGIATKILSNSGISLLACRGNMFVEKDLQNINGFEKYMERYTATKKKFD